MSGRSYA